MSTPASVSSRFPISVPSKVFLIGEYAVMSGGRAWIAAVPPRFTLETAAGAEGGAKFHPESPAGKWIRKKGTDAELHRALAKSEFSDPWGGQGGFGGSTAEFAMSAWLSGVRDPLIAHAEYRAICAESLTDLEQPLPSGADLIAQWVGGIVEWNPRSREIIDRTEVSRRLPLLVFSASHLPGRKTRTHEHLAGLGSMGLEEDTRVDALLPIVDLALSSACSGDLNALGSALSLYGERLSEFGWESDDAQADRTAFTELTPVLGAKGCGAMQSDAMIVLMETLEDESAVSEVIRFAEARGLRLLCRGLSAEKGISG